MQKHSFQAPPLSKFNKVLLIVVAIFFVLHTVIEWTSPIRPAWLLGLSWQGITKGMIFQFVSYPFIQTGLLSFIFECLIIWFIGSELEFKWGKKTYVTFLSLAVIIPAIVFLTIIGVFFKDTPMSYMPLIGMTGITYALLVAYGFLFSERYLHFMLLFPLKAKYFCALLAFIQVYLAFAPKYGKVAWGHLAAMAVGVVFVKYKEFSLSMMKNRLERQLRKQRLSQNKKNFKVIEGDKDKKNDPKYWQ